MRRLVYPWLAVLATAAVLLADRSAAAPAPGRTFYVAPTGSDAGPGTQAKPWRTPGHGSKQLKAGDTLIIKPGTYVVSRYWDDMITPEVSGKPDAWITIRGADPNNRPVLQGKANLLAAVDVGKRSYIRLENLEIGGLIDTPYSGGLREGIEAGGSAEAIHTTSFLTIRNVEIHHVEEGALNLAANSANCSLEGLDIHHAGLFGIGGPSAEGRQGWRNVVLRNCYIHHIGHFARGKEGIFPDVDDNRPDGLGMETSEGPVEIDHCRFEHCRGDGLDSKSRRTYVHDTIIANNRCDSLKLWGDGSRVENVLIYGDGDGDPDNGPWSSITIDTEQPGHFEFTNVTVADNEARGNYTTYVQYENPVPITVVMRNCIIAHGDHLIYFGDSVKLSATNCLFYRKGVADEPVIQANGREYLPSELAALGEGNLSADPRFVRRAWGEAGDFRLQPDSPALDAGLAAGAPPKDLDGKPRPQGKGVDVGAFER